MCREWGRGKGRRRTLKSSQNFSLISLLLFAVAPSDFFLLLLRVVLVLGRQFQWTPQGNRDSSPIWIPLEKSSLYPANCYLLYVLNSQNPMSLSWYIFPLSSDVLVCSIYCTDFNWVSNSPELLCTLCLLPRTLVATEQKYIFHCHAFRCNTRIAFAISVTEEQLGMAFPSKLNHPPHPLVLRQQLMSLVLYRSNPCRIVLLALAIG